MNKYFAIYVYVLCVVHYLCCSIWWCKKHKAKNVEVFLHKIDGQKYLYAHSTEVYFFTRGFLQAYLVYI